MECDTDLSSFTERFLSAVILVISFQYFTLNVQIIAKSILCFSPYETVDKTNNFETMHFPY